MNYEQMLKISGAIDIIVGIAGITLALSYDTLMHRTLSIGFWAIVCIVVCIGFIYKGIRQLELAN